MIPFKDYRLYKEMIPMWAFFMIGQGLMYFWWSSPAHLLNFLQYEIFMLLMLFAAFWRFKYHKEKPRRKKSDKHAIQNYAKGFFGLGEEVR